MKEEFGIFMHAHQLAIGRTKGQWRNSEISACNELCFVAPYIVIASALYA